MKITPQTVGRAPTCPLPAIMWMMARLIVCLSFAHGLVGCEADQDPVYVPPVATTPPPVYAPPSSPTDEISHGYFAGTITEGENIRYVEALLTVDGSVRMYIGGTSGEVFDPVGSMQFVGVLDMDEDQAFGSGIIIGQHCAVEPGPFCDSPVSGDINISVAAQSQLSGEIQVATGDEEETWAFEMSWPTSTYLERATMPLVEGQYEETLAEFAHGFNVAINVDGAGEMFFQSQTGCVGNGILTPYDDGEFNVYGVALTIESCSETYAYLNGEFDGLATRSVDYWSGWGNWLIVWLTSTDGTSSPVAITMWGSEVTGAGAWDY